MFPGVPKLVQSKKLTFEAEIDDRSRPLGSEETLFATASGVVIVQTDDEVGQSETSFEESIHGGADGLTLRRRPADEDDDRFQTRQRWRKRVRSRRLRCGNDEYCAQRHANSEGDDRHSRTVLNRAFASLCVRLRLEGSVCKVDVRSPWSARSRCLSAGTG